MLEYNGIEEEPNRAVLSIDVKDSPWGNKVLSYCDDNKAEGGSTVLYAILVVLNFVGVSSTLDCTASLDR